MRPIHLHVNKTSCVTVKHTSFGPKLVEPLWVDRALSLSHSVPLTLHIGLNLGFFYFEVDNKMTANF